MLRQRDRSMSEVSRYLESRGVSAPARDDVLDRLVRTGLVDDVRFADTRASALAQRGAGDERIRFELESAGIDPDIAAAAIGSLPSEVERAERVIAQRGPSAKTARYLAGRGFSDDVVHSTVARARGETLG